MLLVFVIQMRTINFTDENGEMHKRDVPTYGKTSCRCQVCGKETTNPVVRIIRGPKTDVSWPNADYEKPHYERVTRNIHGKPYRVMKWVVPTPGVEPKEYSTVTPLVMLATCQDCWNPKYSLPEMPELRRMPSQLRYEIVESIMRNAQKKFGQRLTVEIFGRFEDYYCKKACSKLGIKIETVRRLTTPA